MKRLNKIAKRITAYDEVVEQFIKKCENNDKFDKWQIDEISKGFNNGLTIDQVKVYAKPKLDSQQMYDIREDFKKGLTIKEVKEKYNL